MNWLVIKPRSTDTTMGPPCEPPSIWAKNVQLSVFALIIALITAFAKDHEASFKDAALRSRRKNVRAPPGDPAWAELFHGERF